MVEVLVSTGKYYNHVFDPEVKDIIDKQWQEIHDVNANVWNDMEADGDVDYLWKVSNENAETVMKRLCPGCSSGGCKGTKPKIKSRQLFAPASWHGAEAQDTTKARQCIQTLCRLKITRSL